jgi:hypothetical protein
MGRAGRAHWNYVVHQAEWVDDAADTEPTRAIETR